MTSDSSRPCNRTTSYAQGLIVRQNWTESQGTNLDNGTGCDHQVLDQRDECGYSLRTDTDRESKRELRCSLEGPIMCQKLIDGSTQHPIWLTQCVPHRAQTSSIPSCVEDVSRVRYKFRDYGERSWYRAAGVGGGGVSK